MARHHAKLFVIAAPSGAGKTTIVKALVARNPELKFSISYTTRQKRRTEVDGVDYLFVDVEEFERLRNEGELLEFAEVFDGLDIQMDRSPRMTSVIQIRYESLNLIVNGIPVNPAHYACATKIMLQHRALLLATESWKAPVLCGATPRENHQQTGEQRIRKQHLRITRNSA